MDSAPPHVGDGPCCSKSRRQAFTPTLCEEAASTKAKLEAAQVGHGIARVPAGLCAERHDLCGEPC